jgi:ferrochelatase
VTYTGTQNYHHGSDQKIGVLLVNLGTPDAPTAAAVKPYLKQFLSDPRVVEAPRLLWWFILNGIILLKRPRSTAHAYSQVWTDQGSPLLMHSLNQTQMLKKRLESLHDGKVAVELGMTYGNPSVSSALQVLKSQHIEALVVLPLYPQYSGATTGSVFDAVVKELCTWRRVPAMNFLDGYYDEPLYVKALANSIKEFQKENGTADKLIFSYHGLPKRFLESGAPYHCHCYKTTRLVAETLGLEPRQYMLTFQSRFGKEPWLEPYTDETLQSLPSKGVKRIQVISPGFSSDCVETIEELNIQNREFFMDAGGEEFGYIPCLNNRTDHVDLLEDLIQRQLSAILQGKRFNKSDDELSLTKTLAKNIGAAQ